MPVIQFAKTEAVRQIEDFPKDCKRSHDGAMHVRPGSTKVVTEGELDHLRKSKVKVAVLAPGAAEDKKAEDKPQAAPQAAQGGGGSSATPSASAAPSGASGADSDPDSSGKGGKKSGKGGK